MWDKNRQDIVIERIIALDNLTWCLLMSGERVYIYDAGAYAVARLTIEHAGHIELIYLTGGKNTPTSYVYLDVIDVVNAKRRRNEWKKKS